MPKFLSMAKHTKDKYRLFVGLLAASFLWMLLTCYNGYAQTNSKTHDQKSIEIDSSKPYDEMTTIARWKWKRQFAYMTYLDSLLKNQKGLHSDTVSYDEKTGRIVRRHGVGNSPGIPISWMTSIPVKIFFWTLALLFIGYLVFKILIQNKLFSLKKSRAREQIPALQEEELFDKNRYDELILTAESEQHFNAAIRYLFLKTLKVLSEAGLVAFSPAKTNRDYLHQMERHTYLPEFREVIKIYENAWYGKFAMSSDEYFARKNRITSFNEKIARG